ncbi:hypothetical protein FP2506_16139 [Fulvimarina pelagi HTCC2506]|uniref:Uncharacterized protein n=1 Tax=Fulvimarina pelagi HTCC2506 TaxID=314231 RepID=Q0G352_9HYPH|nr:hypothetical protein FP2506_16139 [Fulvimarina pelagi HTCC2506]
MQFPYRVSARGRMPTQDCMKKIVYVNITRVFALHRLVRLAG